MGAVGYLVVAMLLSAMGAGSGLAQDAPLRYDVVGDAIVAALTDRPGNPESGRAIVANRQVGLCLLCHSGPFPEERFQGDLAPDLRGAGKRWTEGQLRLRLVDSTRIKPDTIMPPFHRTADLARVAPALRGKPVLSAQQIEDVLAYLMTLRDDP
jgi:L-cysteine S-thiosulfotransferase